MNNFKKNVVDEEGWVHCPFCRSKTRTKVRKDSLLKNFPLYCPKCKHESIVDIKDMQIKYFLEPDARRRAGNL